VTVVTADPATSRWASQPIDLGGGDQFRSRVIGPEGIPRVTDPDLASREPQLAVLSVLAHGRGDVETAVPIARAAVHAVSSLPEEQQVLYWMLIEQALSEAARKALAMDTQIEKFFSEAHRRSFDRGIAEGEARGKAEGEARGKAEGKAEALLVFLRQRGLAMTSDQQHRIRTCTDLASLDRWLDRAFSGATSVDELLA
jgi:predicted transposase YdaD